MLSGIYGGGDTIPLALVNLDIVALGLAVWLLLALLTAPVIGRWMRGPFPEFDPQDREQVGILEAERLRREEAARRTFERIKLSTSIVAGAFTARDEFDQTAGALTGKVAPVGGTWAGAGDADDFSEGGGRMTRLPFLDPKPDPLSDFAGFAFDSIQALQQELKQVRQELAEALSREDQLEREYALLKARSER